MESSPLQILTDSVLGSNDKLRVEFEPEASGLAHDFTILFTDPPQYQIGRCMSEAVTFNIPDTQIRTWTITKTNNVNNEALSLSCNGIEIFNYLFSTSSNSDCVTRWTTDVVDMLFKGDRWGTDTASDEYREKPTGR